MATKSGNKLKKWLLSLSDEDAIKATSIINQIAKENPQYKTDPEYRKQIDESEEAAKKFEESVAKEISTNLMNEIEIDKHLEKLDKTYNKMRDALISEMQKSPQAAQKLKHIALKMIEIEKEHKLHNPEDWKGLVQS